jgi:hypothetical protein
VIRALGNTVTLAPGQPLTKHDFYLPLADVLLDLVEQDLDGPTAEIASQLGCALADDFLNLATLAGQLLWLVDIAPVRTGTPDSLSISMLAEAYLMQLRTACDVLAFIMLKFYLEEEKVSVPKTRRDSLNRLVGWLKENPSLVPNGLKFVLEPMPWFEQLKGIRDKLVHNRFDINIFTDNVAPSYALMSSGAIYLHFLRRPRTPLDNPLRPAPLLPLLKLFTQGALDLAAQIADAVALKRHIAVSKTHVLNGVYIPALPHLLSFEEPSRQVTDDEKRKRKIKARYLRDAGDYLRAIMLGHPDGFWLPFAVHIEDLFGTKPHHTNGPGHPEYRDGEALIEWRLHFEKEECEYIIVLRDAAYFSADGLEEDKAKVAAFKQKTGATGFILVANESPVSRNIPDESVFDGLIMDTDPIRAAERAYAALVGSTPTESVLPSK